MEEAGLRAEARVERVVEVGKVVGRNGMLTQGFCPGLTYSADAAGVMAHDGRRARDFRDNLLKVLPVCAPCDYQRDVIMLLKGAERAYLIHHRRQ